MWIYKGEVLDSIPEKAEAFVYLIKRLNISEDSTSPYLYVGKKNFYRSNRSDSDWKMYYGSSKYLLDDVEKYGKDNFEREILHICYSKSEATWLEVVEQIERRVLKVDKSMPCKKVYYNSNILGKFYKDTIFTNADIERYKSYMSEVDTIIEKKYVTNGIDTKILDVNIIDLNEFLDNNPGWYPGSSLNTSNKGMKRVENVDGKIIFVNKDEAHKYTPYSYSVCTDGYEDVYINNKDVDDFLDNNDGWYLGSKNNGLYKKVNNGTSERKIHIGLLDDFLRDNIEWSIGGIKRKEKVEYISIMNLKTFSQCRVPENEVAEMLKNGWELSNNRVITHFYKWINNGNQNKKVKPTDIDSFISSGWALGRININNKDKIIVSKEGETRYIDIKELDNYINLGYQRGNVNCKSLEERNKVYVCNDDMKTQFLISKEEVSKFLKNNPSFRLGQYRRDNFNTTNKVFAIDMRTNQKVMVDTEEYKNNKYLTSVKTKRVKIFKGDAKKEVFKGYLKLYCIENDTPSYATLMRFVDKGVVNFVKGINTKYNNLNLRIESMKR